MKFEEVLPLLREGKKFKCADNSGFYIVCKQKLFDMDLGTTIYRIDKGKHDIFNWGISGHSLLSDEWMPYDEDQQETKKIESVMEEAIKTTVFNFVMSVTRPFTPENALLPPLLEPLGKEIIEMLKHFFDEKKK